MQKVAIASSTSFYSLQERSVYPTYLYPLCSQFRLCHTAWECLSTSCFPRLLGMIGCVFLKATKNVIKNVIRGKNNQWPPSPILCSLNWSSFWYLLLGTSFYPLFMVKIFPNKKRTEGIGSASIPKFRLIFMNRLKSSCCCNTVPPYCAFLHLPVCRHLFIEVIASDFTCSARLFISICLYFCTTRCKN